MIPTAGAGVAAGARTPARAVGGGAGLMKWQAADRLSHDMGEKAIKALFKALMGEAEEASLPAGVRVRQRSVERAGYTVKPSRYTTIEAFVPDADEPLAAT